MPTIHDDIEPWLAAAIHDELSPEERTAFDAHLATCATCRGMHHEENNMSTAIENSLQRERPDGAFEQRILSGFRRNTPQRSGGFGGFFNHLFHTRAIRIAGAAVGCLMLMVVGAWLTHPPFLGNEELAVSAVTSEASLGGLRGRLGIIEPQAANANQPVEGLRQLPSFAGNASVENDSNGGEGRRSNGAKAERNVAAQRSTALQRAEVPAPAPPPEKAKARNDPTGDGPATERVAVTGSYVPTAPAENGLPIAKYSADDVAADANDVPPGSSGMPDNRKLIRNAQVELEVLKFDEAVQSITTLATDGRGFVATSSSEKQANGKLRGQVIVKVLPESLDTFLLKLRGLGELKNQTLGTEDVTKEYLDTDSRLKNARAMELRVLDILKTKTSKVADLLEVEKELGRVREQIEQMQGALKYMDAQVQFATVTITLAEKDMNTPAAFLLKRLARLALFSTGVEQTFAEVRGVIDGAKAQVSSSTLDRDSTGEATARLVLLIVPEEADALIERIKGMGRVQNYNEQTDRIAQGGGSGMAENAKVERDKVELSITISRNEQEPALQTTSLRILTSEVTEKVARIKENAAKSGAEIRSSSFSRDPDGQEVANVTLRVAMKNYAALLSSFDQLGKVKDVSVQREDRRGVVNEETAPADISVQVYSQANIVGDETGLFATIRRTLAQGAAALMWSLRMIGVALAFVAPWVLALALVVWIWRRISRTRAVRRAKRESVE